MQHKKTKRALKSDGRSEASTEELMISFTFKVLRSYSEDKGSFLANAIAFSAAFSLFPILLFVASMLGFVLESRVIQEAALGLLATYAPLATEYAKDNITRIIEARGSVGALALGAMLWYGISVFGTLEHALNTIFRVETPRHFLAQRLVEVVVVFLTIVLALLSTGMTIALSVMETAIAGLLAMQNTDLTYFWNLMLILGMRGIAPITAFFMFILIYRLVPNHRSVFHELWPGALFCAIAWELSKMLTGYLVSNIVKYNLIYGSLGSAIIFLTWVYVSAVILVLGAQIIKVRLAGKAAL